MTARIHSYLQSRPENQGPVLVVDLDVVNDNYKRFAAVLPDAEIYYAVKANPEPQILKLLAECGSSFDCASIPEIEMVLATGAGPERISFGNTIKKERDVVRALELGVRLFAVDCVAEVEKIARAADATSAKDVHVYCRFLQECAGAEWPLSRKFGCAVDMVPDVLQAAHEHGLIAHGLSFHVGSQQANLTAWDEALATASGIFKEMSDRGIELKMVNMGGGFPTRYLKDVPTAQAYGEAIFDALRKHFGNAIPRTIIEPGRGMVGNAGIIEAEVVLISTKSHDDATRWVYLDIGKFGGLAETMDEAIRYPIRTPRDGDAATPCVLAGPTCDSVDVLYEKNPYPLPVSLQIGDKILIEATGAYTTTYAANGFNGFDPLRAVCI